MTAKDDWGGMKEPVLSFKITKLEEILYRESSVIAAEDVPLLLKVLLADRGYPIPERIEKEIRDAAIERGDIEDEDAEDEDSEDGPPAPKTFLIPASCRSDDDKIKIQFDAAAWFVQADNDSISELAEADWGGDYPADDVARFFEEGTTKTLFDYVELTSSGFECRVDEKAAFAWLRHNRPEAFKEIAGLSELNTDCKLCDVPCLQENAHLHQGEYIGDECCWDDRFKASE